MNKITYHCKGIVADGTRCESRWSISAADFGTNDPRRMICVKCNTLVDKEIVRKLLEKNKN